MMKQQQDEKTDVDWATASAREEKFNHWVESINKLFDDIQEWLEPLARQDLVQYNRGMIKIKENIPQNLVATYV